VRYWTLDEAIAELPRVRRAVGRIRELAARSAGTAGLDHRSATSGNGHGPAPSTETDLARLVDDLTRRDGIILRDPFEGLVDFPARAPSGRDYLLCWKDGEETIGWWHWPDAGFAGRTPLSDPPE
jgi:hypothetical protein